MCNNPATTQIYTLSLHDALPISLRRALVEQLARIRRLAARRGAGVDDGGQIVKREAGHQPELGTPARPWRSEEHTSELQSRPHLVCRLLLEKKKTASSQAHSGAS